MMVLVEELSVCLTLCVCSGGDGKRLKVKM